MSTVSQAVEADLQDALRRVRTVLTFLERIREGGVTETVWNGSVDVPVIAKVVNDIQSELAGLESFFTAAAHDADRAEAARDAAVIQAGVYPDESSGRAAVEDGEAFKVQGSGEIAAFEYRRVDSSSSILLTTYPSKAALDAVASETAPQNLFDKDVHVIKQRRLSAGSGAIQTNVSYTDDDRVARVPVRPSTSYILSGYPLVQSFIKIYRYEDASQVLISYGNVDSATSRMTLSTPSNCAFIVFSVNNSGGSWRDATDLLQLELGTTPTPYAPHIKARVAKVRSTDLQADRLGPATVVLPGQVSREHVASRGFVLDSMHSIVFRTNYQLPSDLNFAGLQVWRLGQEFHTDYDWSAVRNSISGATYYVDPVNGNDANDGSSGSKLKSIKAALLKSDVAIVKLEPGRYANAESWQGENPGRALRIEVNGEGYAEVTTQVSVIFTPDGTHTNAYSCSYSGAGNANSVVDLTQLDGEGLPMRLRNVTSASLCNRNPGTCYWDAANDKLFVRTWDSREPDADVLVLADTANVVHGNDKPIYMERVRVWGGGTVAAAFTNNTGALKTGVFRDCQFSYGGAVDGFDASGRVAVYLDHCSACYNERDGFNYGALSSISARGLEYYCVGNENGYSSDGANNGSTAHFDCRVLRVAGVYLHNGGRCVHDIDTVVAYNIGVTAGNSRADLAANRASFAVGTGTGMSTTGYFMDCVAVGDAMRLQVAEGCTATVKDGNLLETGTSIVGTLVRSNAVIAVSV